MRKLRFLAFALLGASTMFMTSCKDDEDPQAPEPNLEIIAFTSSQEGDPNEGIEVNSGVTISFAINAAKVGGTDLASFGATVSGANSINPIPVTKKGYNYTTGTQNLKNADDEIYRDTLVIDGIYLNNQGNNTFSFTVTDKNGKSKTRNLTVVIKNAVPLSNEVTGAFFHIGGSLQGAYDLVAGAPIAGVGGDATKQDMKNTDAAGSTFTGSWTAGNSTLFVKDNSFDYSNPTQESAANAYNAGTSGINVNNPASGDIYIARLRGSSDYAVIKVTSVDPADNTCNCANPGKISFDFKKKQP